MGHEVFLTQFEVGESISAVPSIITAREEFSQLYQSLYSCSYAWCILVQGGAFSSARVPFFFEVRVTKNASAGRPKKFQAYSTPLGTAHRPCQSHCKIFRCLLAKLLGEACTAVDPGGEGKQHNFQNILSWATLFFNIL